MRPRIALCLAVTAGIAAWGGHASASPSPQTTGGITYFNAGTDQTSTSRLEIVARGTPADASGRFQVHNSLTGADFKGEINCYNQWANMSRSTGVITSGVVPDGNGGLENARGLFVTITIADDGEGSKASAPDAASVNHRAGRPFDCTVQRTADNVVRHGNVQVHAQSPAPMARPNLAAVVTDRSADEVSD